MGHQADNKGLADGLAAGDGKGLILESPLLEELWREEVPGRGGDGVQYRGVGDALGLQAFNEPGMAWIRRRMGTTDHPQAFGGAPPRTARIRWTVSWWVRSI